MRMNNHNPDWVKSFFEPYSLANGPIADQRVTTLKSQALPQIESILKSVNIQTDPAAKPLMDSIYMVSTHNPLEFKARDSEDMETYIARITPIAAALLFLSAPPAVAREAGINPSRSIIKGFSLAKEARLEMDGKTVVDAALVMVRGQIGNAIEEAVSKKMPHLKTKEHIHNMAISYAGDLSIAALASLNKTLRANSAIMGNER